MKQTAEEFMREAKKQIEMLLVEKLKLLGYFPEDVLSGDPSRKPDMKRYVIYEDLVRLHEEYTVNGIRLFEVKWSKGNVEIIDSAV
jgi:hypothetical protein